MHLSDIRLWKSDKICPLAFGLPIQVIRIFLIFRESYPLNVNANAGIILPRFDRKLWNIRKLSEYLFWKWMTMEVTIDVHVQTFQFFFIFTNSPILLCEWIGTCSAKTKETGVVILTDPPPFLAPPDHFDCCERDPFFSWLLIFFAIKLFLKY